MIVLPSARGALGARTGGDPSFGSVVFLGHFDGTNGSTTLVNSCPRGTTMAAHGTAALSTTSPLFGTASLNVTGAGTSYADSGTSADYTIGAGDFTLELAMYTGSPSQTSNLFKGDGTNAIGLITAGGAYQFRNNNLQITAGGTIPTNTWQRLAMTRSGTSHYLFVDGVLVSGPITSGVNFDLTTFRIGTDFAGAFPFTGNVDELRLTVGVARYTATYTPAAAAFPDF